MTPINRTPLRRVLAASAAALPVLASAGQDKRPNILLIVVDDMGYSDMGCFGGEIETPNLNHMAQEGVRFAQFYNSGRSCPSRAQLLTGCYPHTCGITGMGLSLSKDCVTIPEALKSAGYRSAMSGKWHLSLTKGIGNNADQMKWLSHQDTFDNRPFAPLDTYPCNRGFDDHIGTIWGVVNHFDPFSLVHNEEALYTDAIPSDFYSTDFVTKCAIDYIDGFAEGEEPFFLYVAYNAPHWPLHAKPADIAKYKGKYDGGWDQMRKDRYKRMVDLGLVLPEETPEAENTSGRDWDAETDKEFQAANMEVHAAMIDCVDQGVGRIMDELKAKGLYDNTIVVFTSDNGASSENYKIGDFDRHNMTRSGETVVHNSRTPGDELSYNYLGTGWAGAVNAPFRYWKTESYHGGTCAPTIIQWPAGLKAEKGSIERTPCHFMDVMPTCLELAGAKYPSVYNGHGIQSLPEEARSLVPLLKGEQAEAGERTMFWEHEGGKAVRKGNWRLTQLRGGTWKLYDLSHDLSETTDLSAQYPEKVKELTKMWKAWAKGVGLDVSLTIEAGRTYTISNRNDNTLYVQDNGGNVIQMGTLNDNSFWSFEPTGNEDCFYLKNTATGRYAQLCNSQAEVNVTMGTEPVEYKVLAADVEGKDCFGLTTTNLSNTEFTAGCIGWNWKGDNTVQTFAAQAGTNHRSFWLLTESMPLVTGDSWPLEGRTFTIRNNASNSTAYMQDNDDEEGTLECGASVTGTSYWTFEKADGEDNYHCYYIRNAETGRYMQPYPPAQQEKVTVGEEKSEYYVRNFLKEGSAFGLASTSNVPFVFTEGTIGLNLYAETNEPECYVQTYPAVAGANHRSFWQLREEKHIPTGIIAIPSSKRVDKGIYNVLGQKIAAPRRGLNIVDGKKVVM